MQTEQDVEIKWLNSEVEDITQKLEICHETLSVLVSHLLRSYEDDFWSDNTRELFDDINAYLGHEPIVWNLDDGDVCSAEVPEALAISKAWDIDEACRLAAEKFKKADELRSQGDDLLDPVAEVAINCSTYEEAYTIYHKMPFSFAGSELLVYLRGGT